MSDPPRDVLSPGFTTQLIDAFVRLARADFTVRLERTNRRDTEDVLALFVNLIAEELDRLLREKERQRQELESGVSALSELFLRLAAADFSVRAQRSNTGDPLDVLAYLFNNTAAEVGEAFAEIERQRAVLAAIFESMIDGVLVLDGQGSVVRANAAALGLVGLEATEVEGKPFAELLSSKERSFARELVTLLEAGPFRDRETVFLTNDGDALALTVNGSPQRNADGTLAGAVLLLRDDRELKQAQAQLQLADRLATMGTLAAGVAHEVNNPLAFVIGNLDFISEELENVADEALGEERAFEVHKALRASQDGAERVRQIVLDLKSFSRVDQQAVSEVDPSKLLDTAANMIRNEVRHHARLEKRYGDDVPLVQANEARLVQVFINLIQNAAQAIEEGGVEDNRIVLVSGRAPSGEAFVEVHDTGKGIGEDTLPRIFDAFFTTKPVGVGTGLGLSICHKIVSSLGGRIEVESVVGTGTCFRIVLPAAGASLARKPSEAPPVRPRRRRVLVVDDEREVGDSLVRLLGKDHEIVAVTRGADALALLAERDFDVLLVDAMMPEMNGLELYRRLQETNPEHAGRVVFVSGGVFGADVDSEIRRSGRPRLDKPFEPSALSEVLLGDSF